jgi:hypothetical protein
MSAMRDKVISALHVLSAKEAQYDLLRRAESDPERQHPFNLVDDLWHLWFDRAYRPQDREFGLEFSAEVREGLESFTQFFRLRLPLLPRRFEKLMNDINWRGVTEYASLVLDKLALDESAGRDG